MNVKEKIKLNKEQEQAASHFEGPCFASAAPGSGKTTVIVERTARLLRNGVPAKSILNVTFTNKAADEMRARCLELIGDESADIHISTFHALSANILRKLGSPLGYSRNMTIYDDDEQVSLMHQVSRKLGYDIGKPTIKEIKEKLNNMREDCIPESEIVKSFKDRTYGETCLAYIDRMRKSNCLDFSGLLSETIRLLENHQEPLERIRKRFKFLQIDEVQDTSHIQFKFIKMIGTSRNIFMVGDTDQTIYSWRSARYQNISDFISEYDANVIRLPKNYRSTPEIVEASDKLIKYNNRNDEGFETDNPSGPPVIVKNFRNPDTEGRCIARMIRRLMDIHDYKPEDFAILYRINSMSRSMENGLMNEAINYTMIGGYSFFDRMEIRDCVSMMKFFINPHDGISLSRFINKPASGIGNVTIGKIENFSDENDISLLESISRGDEYLSLKAASQLGKVYKKFNKAFNKDYSECDIGDIMKSILGALEYESYLRDYDPKTAQERIQNVEELMSSASMFSQEKGNDIALYLNNIALTSASDKETEKDCVHLMTIHSAKGLEFPVVFVMCCEDGMLPFFKCIDAEGIRLAEERRLCYVGMTRAKHRLIMTWPRSRMIQKMSRGHVKQFRKTKPSRFLYEAGLLDDDNSGQY